MILTLFILFLLLNIADIILTNKILSQGGQEKNRLVKWLIERMGNKWGYVKFSFVTFVIGGCVLVLRSYDLKCYDLIILCLVNIIYLYVVFHNIEQLRE